MAKFFGYEGNENGDGNDARTSDTKFWRHKINSALLLSGKTNSFINIIKIDMGIYAMNRNR